MLLVVRNLRRLHLRASFELGDGECVAVWGASGSGKTLLLRALADLDPNDGTILLDGALQESVPAPAWRRLVTFVAAEPGWWADTVREHFVDWSRAGPLVESLGLPGAAACGDWPIARLSTGERQRLALARALQLPSRVLLLDEPTASLDAAATAAVEALIAERRRMAGTAVLWVTHDRDQARRVASRVLVVRAGSLAEALATAAEGEEDAP